MTVPDTIAAVASPMGRGAVGVIRVSGPDVPRIAMTVLGTEPPPRVARLSLFLDADGRTLDRGLALYFPAPASFTGEAVLELQGHGGAQVMDLVIRRLLALGCRLARPGEFSERAFLNGKMDVAQAEAVADLIDAGTSMAARAAVRSMQGEFSARIHELQSELIGVRVQVEAAIDFPDDDIDVASGAALKQRLTQVIAGFASIQAAARQGALLRDGLTLVIAGKPNVGKSSLLNRLVGDDVAIVTDVAGTTRDVLKHALQLDGLPLEIIDTAGLRTATDPVEEEGIRRAKAQILRADRILYLVDATQIEAVSLPSELAELASLAPGVPVTVVFNKVDLIDPWRVAASDAPTRLFISARTGAGIDALRTHLKTMAGYDDNAGSAFSARRRHLDALSRARELVERAAGAEGPGVAELIAEDLRLAHIALGEITGEFTSDDLLGEIFGSFCIGK